MILIKRYYLILSSLLDNSDDSYIHEILIFSIKRIRCSYLFFYAISFMIESANMA